MKYALVLIASTALAACQGCRNPQSAPVPTPVRVDEVDAGEPPDTTVIQEDAGDGGAAEETDECRSVLLGPDFRFCDGKRTIRSSVTPASIEARGQVHRLPADMASADRLVIRHVNGTTSKTKVVVVLVNDGRGPGGLTLLRKGVAGPTTDLQAGEALATGRWTTSTASKTVTVQPGKSVRFDQSIEVGMPKRYGTMGMYEYSFDQPHTVHVCMLGEREDFSICPTLQ